MTRAKVLPNDMNYRAPLEEHLRKKLYAWLKKNTPPGMQIRLNEQLLTYVDVELVCSGVGPGSRDRCMRAVGHEGRCRGTDFVDFDRTNKTPIKPMTQRDLQKAYKAFAHEVGSTPDAVAKDATLSARAREAYRLGFRGRRGQ